MQSSLSVVLVHPGIPQNTGNIIRLCANTGSQLFLVKPCGFEWNDNRLRRAHLDYDEFTSVTLCENWMECVSLLPGRRLFAVETGGPHTVFNTTFEPGDVLVLGSEATGLPEDVLATIPQANYISLPMMPGSRSLNLSNATAISVYEAWRQLGFPGGNPPITKIPFAFTNGMDIPVIGLGSGQ